ncbi:unknown protein [Seminavis robusta]|uniref:Uncharacterized protein n=1 Tax=Seminavis robusta TaxID=568900 RepID=A0A9N8HXU5_9STRA|nr:unknown protein [Seminavis robusta]|eukprot:Sro2623_g332900.1 n/a (264) ;mRNA; f:4535-5326
MVATFITINDNKKRKEYKSAHGGNPVKDFWHSVSEMVNDPSNNTVIGVVLFSNEDEDARLHKFNQDGEFNLNEFNHPQMWESCQQLASDAMKARENCLGEMRKSGQGSADMWNYCTTTKFCKLRKSCTVPAKAVYYCEVLCKAFPDIDGKFAAFMTSTQQSDSEVALTGSAGAAGDSTGTVGRKNKQLDSLCTAIVLATTNMSDNNAVKREVSEEKARLDAEKAKLESEDRAWNQYTSISDQFLSMLQDRNKISLARNMAVRI